MIELTVFLAGGIIMSFEILGSRVLRPHFGDTIFIWGSLISVFLGGLTLGYWFGGNLADRRLELRIFSLLFIIPGIFLCLFPLYADALCTWIWELQWDDRYGSLLASLFLFLLPTMFLGAISPYAIRLRVFDMRYLGSRVGNLYAISSLGSILGTLFTSFYLIAWFGVRSIIVVEGVMLLLIGSCLLMAWKLQGSTQRVNV
jgi:MFS family permease